MGELTRLRKVIRDEGSGGSHELKTSDTSFVYDGWGNVTDQTVYGVEGSTTFDSNWGLVSDNPATGDARTTTTEYDDTHHTLPIHVEQPAVGGYTPTEEREYYDVNESNGSGAGLPGQLKRVWDTNNDDSTWYQYDSFGRLRYQWRPGETTWNTAQAGVAYEYNDTTRRRYTRQRDDTGTSPTYLQSWQFYDGLGRLIQSQAESATSGQSILTNRAYDAAGRLEKESLPYFYAAAGGTYRTPDWGQPYTAYQYDALGRVKVITNPDGTTVQHYYGFDDGLACESVYDENNHAKQYRTDSFGRLVQAREYEEGDVLYATIQYAYDLLDNLTDVWDEDNNHSHMEYDLLGRKETMHDPDMGDWSYTYDALGNLTTQFDAKGQTISFYYDALNRLTKKDYPSGSDVFFKYDNYKNDATTKNSWGRLRLMYTGSESANGHLYEYDDRGRVTKEQTKIDSTTYNTLYTYDAADRVKTTTYPGGEVVTSGYNTQGLPETLTGDATYVTGATYTALGQTDLLQFGNGTQTDYIYDETGNNRLNKIRTGFPGQESLRQHLAVCRRSLASF